MPRSNHTPEQRSEILAYYREHGALATELRHGVNRKTVASWARRAGVQVDAPTCIRHLEVAREMAAITREQRAAEQSERTLEIAERVLQRMQSESTVVKVVPGQGIRTVVLDEPEPTDLNALVSAYARLVSASQLLAGKVTERVGSEVTEDELKRFRDEVEAGRKLRIAQ